MSTLLLAFAITITVLTISSISSPKLRVAIYSLPLPATIMLLGTGGTVNATHLLGLMLTVTFMFFIWLLSKRLHVDIVPAIILGVALYVLLGTLSRFVLGIPFMLVYGLFVIAWLMLIVAPIRLRLDHYKNVKVDLHAKDYIIRGGIVFLLAYFVIGIKGLILGTAVTFPFNGIFTTYVMREQLPVLMTEQLRNFFGLFNFFLVIWYLQPKAGLVPAIAVGWVVCFSLIYGIVRYLPRKYRIA